MEHVCSIPVSSNVVEGATIHHCRGIKHRWAEVAPALYGRRRRVVFVAQSIRLSGGHRGATTTAVPPPAAPPITPPPRRPISSKPSTQSGISSKLSPAHIMIQFWPKPRLSGVLPALIAVPVGNSICTGHQLSQGPMRSHWMHSGAGRNGALLVPPAGFQR